MKKLLLSSLSLLALFCLNQVSAQLPSYQKDSTALLSRKYALEINTQLNQFLYQWNKIQDYKFIDSAEALIKTGMAHCGEFNPPIQCLARMNFNAGYFFQEAASTKSQWSSSFYEKARNYYRNVLKYNPGDKIVLQNLSALPESTQSVDSTIAELNRRAEKDIDSRADYFGRIGDLYVKSGNLHSARTYYHQAFKSDPFSEPTIKRLIRFYKDFGINAAPVQTMIGFAYYCQEIKLANYAEEITRNVAFKYTASAKMDSAIIATLAWTDILANNGWIDSSQIQYFLSEINTIKTTSTLIIDSLNSILSDLQHISSLPPDKIKIHGFWASRQPGVFIGRYTYLRPVTTMIKVLHFLGQQAYQSGAPDQTERYWTTAQTLNRNQDPVLYCKVAKDLANYYNQNPSPANEKKLKNLISQLFDQKFKAYLTNDKLMIREYHITLANILFDNEQYNGTGYDNAKYQLTHALDPELGPIVSPELQLKLARVYEDASNFEGVLEQFIRAAKDYLMLDGIEEAEALLDSIPKINKVKDLKLDRVKELKTLIQARKDLANPDYAKKIMHEQFPKELKKSIEYMQRIGIKDKPFTSVQLFKGLSDLTANLPDKEIKFQQLTNAEALLQIEEIHELFTTSDFNRIQLIKNSFEYSLEADSKAKQSVRLNPNIDYTENKTNPQEQQTYIIPNLNVRIQVPQVFFTLGKQLHDYYKSDEKADVPIYKFEDNKFSILKNN